MYSNFIGNLIVLVAVTMLPRPEPNKQRVESTTLGKTATKFHHSTRFTLLLLKGIKRYMWRDRVATCCMHAYATYPDNIYYVCKASTAFNRNQNSSM